MSNKRDTRIYGLYQGEKLLCDGTLAEIAELRNVSIKTLQHMRTPSYINRKNHRSTRLELVLVQGKGQLGRFKKAFCVRQYKNLEKEGHSISEIANLLGMSVPTLRERRKEHNLYINMRKHNRKQKGEC